MYLGQTGHMVCPVTAMLAYLAILQPTPGLLFIFHDGTPLTSQSLVVAMQQALQKTGLEVARFTGHSFHIGTATTAAQVGLSDSLIKALGQWKSSA